jgi:hypothetical protein
MAIATVHRRCCPGCERIEDHDVAGRHGQLQREPSIRCRERESKNEQQPVSRTMSAAVLAATSTVGSSSIFNRPGQ